MRAVKASYKTRSLHLSICLGLWLGFVAPGFAAQGADAPMSAQERLDAIRLSLVENSLQTPTKVITTSWIDASGSLRESSSFKNGMEVRGVRVLSYTRDEAGQPKAKIQTTTAPLPTSNNLVPTTHLAASLTAIKDFSFKGLFQKLKQTVLLQNETPATPICTSKVMSPLHQLVSLEVDVEPSSHPVVIQSVLTQLQSQWLEARSVNANSIQVKPWKAFNNLPPASMSNKMTAYERALVSNRLAALPWQAKLKVRTEVLPAQGLEMPFTFNHPSLALNIDFELTGNEGQATQFEDHFSLVIDLVRKEWAPAQLSSESRELIQAQFQTWRSQAEQWLGCQQPTPMVTAVYGKQLEINAGSLAGVKRGDEWLVANPMYFPSELAGKDGASQTLLAKVQSVTPFNAQLVVLAGPAQVAQTEWRAWPTEVLLKEPHVQAVASGSYIRDAMPAKRPSKPSTNPSSSLGSAAY